MDPAIHAAPLSPCTPLHPACSNLEGCRLRSGQLPDSLADLTSLQYLNLGTNDLQTTLPAAWGGDTKFTQLTVSAQAEQHVWF